MCLGSTVKLFTFAQMGVLVSPADGLVVLCPDVNLYTFAQMGAPMSPASGLEWFSLLLILTGVDCGYCIDKVQCAVDWQ